MKPIKSKVWKEYFPKTKKTHLVTMKPCPSCEFYYTPQPKSEKIANKYLFSNFECDEPTGIIEPCTELGYNNFPSTNFHGELSIEETEQLRQKLIQSLKDEGKLDKVEYIENNTRVMEVTFNCA